MPDECLSDESAAKNAVPPIHHALDLATLTAWGAAPVEALKAIESADAARAKLITKELFGAEDIPTDWPGFEHLFFKAIKHSSDPAKELRESLARPDFSEQMNKDPAGFIRRLHEFMASKRGDDFDKIDNLLAALWSQQMPSRLLPPFCIMTDRFLVWALGISSEDAARQRVQRLGLYRPSRPRVSMEEVIQDGKSYARITTRLDAERCSTAEFREFIDAWMKSKIQSVKKAPDP